MGGAISSSASLEPKPQRDGLLITGIAAAWPDLLIGPDALQKYAENLYGAEPPWLQRLIKINSRTGIQTRAVVDLWNDPKWHEAKPPSAEDVDAAYRLHGTRLATRAARGALEEAKTTASQVTHMVAVTATNAGSPGYDQLVAQQLGLPDSTEKALLNGVGCAGGLAAVRVACNFAAAASQRDRNANVLVMACEITSIQIRAELHAASSSQSAGVGPALFGDGAAALVISNSRAVQEATCPIYRMIDWHTSIVPESYQDMSYKVNDNGFLLHLSKNVPKIAAASVSRPFQDLVRDNGQGTASPRDFDWALHPGGASIISGVQEAMGLHADAVRASRDVYQTRGNSSSVAVIGVLDRLRAMGPGKEDVIACSFGPGLTVEMALLKRLN